MVIWLHFFQTNSRATALLIDEFDTSGFERTADR